LDTLQFLEGPVSPAYTFAFEPSIFNTSEYLFLQRKNDWTSFYLVDTTLGIVHAHIHFWMHHGHAQSSVQSPFGGLEFSPEVSPQTLCDFLAGIRTSLEKKGISKITITHPPRAYESEKLDLIETFLYQIGFREAQEEVSALIPITDQPFQELIHPRKKRKLMQSENRNLRFEELPSGKWSEVFYLIAQHRKKKSYPLSITDQRLQETIQLFGDRYPLFGVYHQQELVAASVTVVVNRHILYHFLSDHVRKVGEASPVLILMKGIYDYGYRHEFKWLDLGTSTLENAPNLALIKFKTEIGGRVTSKRTFTWDIYE
jgi:hypothetical protein